MKALFVSLPVWAKSGLDFTRTYGPEISAMPDVWKNRGLAYKSYFIRIDERHGFAVNDERARAVICVVEKSKFLAQAWLKNEGRGFMVPEGLDAFLN